MARSIKKGLDYFPLDVQMEDKVKLIEAKHGIEGFGILIKLYQKIYLNGYYIKWQEENALLFSNEINVDINKINDIMSDCLCWNIFNKCLLKKYKILTSHGIQVRYVEATFRRKKVKIVKEISTLSDDELNKNVVYVNIKDINDDINLTNDDINKQSKVKESKVKKSRVNKVHCPAKKQQDIPYEKIVTYLNKRCGTNYRTSTNKTKQLIKARWNEGFRLEDFKTVIDKKCVEWTGNKKMEKYLRPPTLFSNKFESYLNQLSVNNDSQSKKDKQDDIIRDLYQEYKEEEE